MSIATLDRHFSIYIRLRDANSQGYCTCISSGKLVHWKDCDAGHFINRRYMALRYNEMNVNAQSRHDNRFCEGNMEGYRIGLIKKYGPGSPEKLYAFKNQVLKLSKSEIEIMTKHYMKEAAKLRKEKGLF